jgi:hypothetical protein
LTELVPRSMPRTVGPSLVDTEPSTCRLRVEDVEERAEGPAPEA